MMIIFITGLFTTIHYYFYQIPYQFHINLRSYTLVRDIWRAEWITAVRNMQ